MATRTLHRGSWSWLLAGALALTGTGCSESRTSSVATASTRPDVTAEVSTTTTTGSGVSIDASSPTTSQQRTGVSASTTTQRPAAVPSETSLPATPPAPPPAPAPLQPPTNVRVSGVTGTGALMLWTQSTSPGVSYRVFGVGVQAVGADFGPFTTIEAGMPLQSLHLRTTYDVTVAAIGQLGQLSAPITVRFTTTAGVAPVSNSTATTVCANQLVKLSVVPLATDADHDIARYNLVSQAMPAPFAITEAGTGAGSFVFTVPSTASKGTTFKFSWTAKDSQGHVSLAATWTFKVGTLLLSRCT